MSTCGSGVWVPRRVSQGHRGFQQYYYLSICLLGTYDLVLLERGADAVHDICFVATVRDSEARLVTNLFNEPLGRRKCTISMDHDMPRHIMPCHVTAHGYWACQYDAVPCHTSSVESQ